MKKIYSILFLMSLLCMEVYAQERYLEEVFDEVNREVVVYGSNYTVITGTPQLTELEVEIYTPVGDSETNRPLFIYFHTGNFLPNPTNLSTGGTNRDSSVVEIANRLAKMGYVVGVADYRKGWNPVGDLDTRISTLINAAYRGIQDARSCVRFFRKTAVDESNPFGIDPDNIAYFGQGTGGYISFGAATLDNYTDILIPKFIGPDITGDGNPDPYVLEPIHGDPFGTQYGINPFTGDTLCKPNHVNYSDGTPINSDVQLSVNLGGALADTSWVSSNNPPMVSYHVPTDPFAPYMESVLIVPTTGDQIVEVQGSYLAQFKANELGLNDVFASADLNDVFTQAANENNDGLNGLYPLHRPIWTNPFNDQPAPENAPWEWWDPAFWSQFEHPSCPDGVPVSQCNFHVIGSIFNQDMSPEKARIYIDTIIGYLAPRAFLAFGLTGTDVQNISESDVDFIMYPNPSAGKVHFESDVNSPMHSIEIYDINGRLIFNNQNINTNSFQLQRNNWSGGMYFAKIRFQEGVLVKRIVFK